MVISIEFSDVTRAKVTLNERIKREELYDNNEERQRERQEVQQTLRDRGNHCDSDEEIGREIGREIDTVIKMRLVDIERATEIEIEM